MCKGNGNPLLKGKKTLMVLRIQGSKVSVILSFKISYLKLIA